MAPKILIFLLAAAQTAFALDPAGHLQMPGARIISGAPDGKRWYDVNEGQSGQEAVIKELWK